MTNVYNNFPPTYYDDNKDVEMTLQDVLSHVKHLYKILKQQHYTINFLERCLGVDVETVGYKYRRYTWEDGESPYFSKPKSEEMFSSQEERPKVIDRMKVYQKTYESAHGSIKILDPKT